MWNGTARIQRFEYLCSGWPFHLKQISCHWLSGTSQKPFHRAVPLKQFWWVVKFATTTVSHDVAIFDRLFSGLGEDDPTALPLDQFVLPQAVEGPMDEAPVEFPLAGAPIQFLGHLGK